MAVSVIPVIMPKTECQDLLLDFFECKLMIIPHAEEFFYFLVRCGRNMYRTIVVLGKASAYDFSVTLIRLDSLFATSFQHRGRSKDLAVDMVIGQLVI